MREDKSAAVGDNSRSMASNLGAVVSGSFVRSVLLVVQGLLVSRFLGVKGYGEFSIALAVVALIFGVLDFRVQHAAIKFLSEAETWRAIERRRLAMLFLFFEVAKGWIGFAAALAGGAAYSAWLGHDDGMMPTLVALAIHKLAMTANPTLTAFLRIRGFYRSIAAYDLAFGVLSLVLVVGAAMEGRSALAVAQAYLLVGVIGGLAKVLWTWWLLRPGIGGLGSLSLIRSWREVPIDWRELVRFMFGVNLAATFRLAARHLDVVILGRFVSLDVVGAYSLARRLKNLFAYFTDPLLVVLFPEFAKAWSRERFAWMGEALRRSIRWGFAIGLPGFAALAIAAWYLVPRFFGADFSPAVSLLWFFLPDAVAGVACFALPHFVLATGGAGSTARGALLRLIVLAVAGAVLTAFWGAKGMAVAVGLATMANVAVLALAARDALHRQSSHAAV